MPPGDHPPRGVTPRLLEDWPLPEPDDGGGKHSRGTVLVVGGATSTPGAVLLAGLGALRVGAGRLQIATVETTSVALAVSVPEAMVVGLPADDEGSLCAGAADQVAGLAARCDTVVVGPGLTGGGVGELLAALLPRLAEATVVLDAVALSAVGARPELLAPARDRAVVAVHGGVACPDGRAWADEAGGIGLGTSGSGDVLAGAIGGLLARGAEPAQAAVLGQYLHAAAGDRLAARVGRMGFLARELLDELPAVLTVLRA